MKEEALQHVKLIYHTTQSTKKHGRQQ